MRVAVLGAAFKPNSDDIRDSPALDVAASIQKQGAAVCLYDPEAMDNARIKHPELGYRDSAVEAARGADIVLHLTEWAEFREMDPAVLSEVVARSASSTAATPSTPPPGAPPAGPTARSAARSAPPGAAERHRVVGAYGVSATTRGRSPRRVGVG
jgi:hypothetical protein